LSERYIDIPRILMNNRNFKEQLQKLYQAKFPFSLRLSWRWPRHSILILLAAIDEEEVTIRELVRLLPKKQAEQLGRKASYRTTKLD